jgi:hypothetical protein
LSEKWKGKPNMFRTLISQLKTTRMHTRQLFANHQNGPVARVYFRVLLMSGRAATFRTDIT